MLTDEVSEGTDSLFSDAESVVGDVVALFLCTREDGSIARLWEAVSYTHLDVYKRQMFASITMYQYRLIRRIQHDF